MAISRCEAICISGSSLAELSLGAVVHANARAQGQQRQETWPEDVILEQPPL
jgi:hypothetical protein